MTIDDRVMARLSLMVDQAKDCPKTFVELCLRHEKTGEQLENQWFHEKWQDAVTDHDQVVIHCAVEHGKTNQITVGRVLWEIGRNPNIRIAIISETSGQAKKIMAAIKANIEKNPWIRLVFPGMTPGKTWNAEAITVDRDSLGKDYTVLCSGMYGPVNSSRLDFAILDDCLDFENTRTREQREKACEWLENTVITRVVDGGKYLAVGTPWHKDDYYHQLARRPAVQYFRYAAVENPHDPPGKWRPIWPAQFSVKRLISKQGLMAKATFRKKYLLLLTSEDDSRFDANSIKTAKLLGKGQRFSLKPPSSFENELPCVTGVDIGIGRTNASAQSVILTIAIDPRGRRVIIDIQAGKWRKSELVKRICATQVRYNSTVYVESNGAQDFITQDLEYEAHRGRMRMTGGKTPVVRHYTGKNKNNENYGVESLSTELDFGLWIFPSGFDGDSCDGQLNELIQEMQDYDPTLHTGDRLMAMWIAREGARDRNPKWGHLDLLAR